MADYFEEARQNDATTTVTKPETTTETTALQASATEGPTIMAYPPRVSLATITIGAGRTMFGTPPKLISATVTPIFQGTPHVVHAASGWAFYPSPQTFRVENGEELTFDLPHVNAEGWRDTAGNEFPALLESGERDRGWAYHAKFTVIGGSGQDAIPHRYEKIFQPLVGQTEPLDIDLVPDGQIGVPVHTPTATVTSVDGKTGNVTLDPVTVAETEPGVYRIVGAAGEMESLLRSWGIRPEPSVNWAHWGDSMTAASSSGNWVGKYATAVGHSAYNGGVGGQTAEQIHARMTGSAGEPYRDRRFTIGVGRNGYKTTAPEVIVDLIHDMIRHLRVAPRGFVFDVPPWSEETLPASWGSTRDRIEKLNAMLKEHFPDYYLPVFTLLRTTEAAHAAGIRFTEQDQTDIANGVTPISFRSDSGHLNDAGGTAVAYFVQKEAQRRQLVTSRAIPAPPNWMTNFAVVPDPSINIGWTGSGNGVIPYTNSQGVHTYEAVTGMDLPTAARFVGAAGQTLRPEITIGRETATRVPIPAEGGQFTASVQVRASKTLDVQLRIRSYTASGSTQLWGPTVTLQAGVPQRISITRDLAPGVTHIDATALALAGAMADQSSMDVTAFMVTKGPTVHPYRDGNSTGWAWDGTPKQSTSTGPIPA